MLQSSVSKSKPDNVGEKTAAGIKRGMQAAADVGFGVAFDESPDGATSGYRMGWVEPTWVGESLVWGNTVEYAWAIEEGLDPGHWIPTSAIPNLALWADRVIGASDPESAAWGVRQKIGERGTDGQHVAQAGVEAQNRHLHQQGLLRYIEAEFDE